MKVRAWVAGVAAVAAVAAASAVFAGPAADPAVAQGHCAVFTGDRPLQDAVNQNVCVQLPAGTHVIDRYLRLPGGHQLQGDPTVARDAVVLQAGPGWINNAGDGVVNDDGFGGPVATVTHLTVDGAGIATGGIGARRLLIHDVVVRGGKCWGVAVAGELMTIQNSWIHHNGADPACFGAPGAGIYMVTQLGGGRPSVYSPVVVGNRISDNTGPGLDIASVWDGTLSDNVVVNNTSWAGVSLFGSRWTISNNVVRHPATREGQPYLSSCRNGPIGVGSAAIFLCQTNDFNNNVTTANTIVANRVSSWYGVLIVGNDGFKPYYTPRGNIIRDNDAFGSLHGFADDFRPGQWFDDRNHWFGNRPTLF